jgi:hypothetical protein
LGPTEGFRGIAIGPHTDRRVAIACFGAAAAVGLVFAFVGLDFHSFWFDELFTARLIEPQPGTTLLSRAITDVHPPLYLVALSLFTELFGASDAALRAFSAACACGAIAVFVLATRSVFSLPARLFGAALATGSLFWFFHAQNVRSYALCMLISAGILAVGLSALKSDVQGRDRRRALSPARLGLMLGLMVLGTFTHFYMLYVSLGVLGMLFLLGRGNRLVLIAAGAALVVAVELYLKLVIGTHSLAALDHNWYPNFFGWYVLVLKSCLRYTFDVEGGAALILCAIVTLHNRRGGAGWLPDRVTLFVVGVPLAVIVAGIASSVLMTPNFFDRNVLVVSPFFWALSARAYDAATEKASPFLRLALVSALSIVALSMTGIVASRLPSGEAPSMYEPYRQSAEWIRTLPACQGQVLAVVSSDNPGWYKPGYADYIYDSGYGRYLQGFAKTKLVFTRDLEPGAMPADLVAELQRRLNGQGCPVIAWSAHNMNPKAIATIEERLLAALGRPGDAERVTVRRFDDGAPGYVLHIQR